MIFYARYTHRPLAICSNDAKSCYDRIVLMVAALCLCRLGAPKPAVQSMVTTIHGMQHHMRLTYGDSTTHQGRAQWTSPIAGIGQGNGAGPQIWAVVSTPLFQILTTKGFIAQIICTMSNHKLEIAGFRFVDDIDLCIMDTSQDGKQVCNRMQESINMWSGLLHATGGALVPEKCFWYYIHNNWDKGHWKYDTTPQAHGMYILDDDGRPALIPQL